MEILKIKIINKIDQSMIKNKVDICILIRLNIALISITNNYYFYFSIF